MAMRKFQCADCGHVFEVAHGTGTTGRQMTCPACGSRNVHRAADEQGPSRAGRGRCGMGRGQRQA